MQDEGAGDLDHRSVIDKDGPERAGNKSEHRRSAPLNPIMGFKEIGDDF
jgi:hypothetical protein